MNRMLALAVLVVVALVPRPGAAADAAQQEANKKAVVEFYDKAINQKDFGAASAYLGSRYTQHNPNAADGPEGLQAFLQFLKEKFPASRSEIGMAAISGCFGRPPCCFR